jgi:hypothetical protein
MQLLKLRHEAKLREARSWVASSFNPRSVEDFAAITKTHEYTYFRMVSGYWEMASSFVVHGAIDPEMFRAVSGEMLVAYCKVEHMIDELREGVGQPSLCQYVQQAVDDWSGAKERMAGMREYSLVWLRQRADDAHRFFEGAA